MANRKLFNSKNITHLIETLLENDKQDLVMQILQTRELKSLTPNILKMLERKNLKLADYKSTKIYSKTELGDEVFKVLSAKLGLNLGGCAREHLSSGGKIIIDEKTSAGVRVKSGSRLVDATMTTMLQKGIEELLK